MRKIQATKYIIASAIILMLVFTNKSEAATATVTTETLNLRKETSTSSEIVELLNSGEEVTVISEEGNWYKVKHGDKEGYVSKDYVKLNGTIEQNNEPATPTESNANNEPSAQTTSNINNEQEMPIPLSENNNSQSTIVKLEQSTDIRILPLINSSILGIANSGDEVTVISRTNNWMFIQTDEISGWIINNQVQRTNTDPTETNNDTNSEEPENQEDNNSQHNDNQTNNEENNQNIENNTNENIYSNNVTKYVNATSIYVRSEPSTDGEVVTSLIKNTDVTVTGESGDWYKVEFDEKKGYIRKDLLSDTKLEITNRSGSNIDRKEIVSNSSNNLEENENYSNNSNSSSLGEQIVEYAKQYLGCPYVYGGSGSSSFDCSGFTMYVYKHFGYSLSHLATAQSKNGTYVAKTDLQPGDLVFFLEYDTMDGIGHCGIYIGDGNFIHASSGTGYCVKISTLTSGSYSKRYATARRLI